MLRCPPYIRRMNLRFAIIALSVVTSGCFLHRSAALPASIPPAPGEMRTSFALRHIDVAQGTGVLAEPRKCFYVHYSGWLLNGTKFDSSRVTAANGTTRNPLSFAQGARRVIAGWDLGFEGMRVGGRRRLFIPYQLA